MTTSRHAMNNLIVLAALSLCAAGDTLVARSFGKQAKLVSPAFEGGGEEAWKKNIEERRQKAASRN